MRRRASIIGIALLLGLGCSPLSRLKCRFDLPKGHADREPARLHVRARVVCNGEGGTIPSPPEPGLEEESEESLTAPPDGGMSVLPRAAVRRASVRREGWSVELSERGSSCLGALTAWYDADGDGKVGSGDFVGEVPATLFRDRGLCAGNLTVVDPVAMRGVSSRP